MSLIRDLTESKLITSRTSYRKYSGTELAEMLYLHILTFRILAHEEHEFAHEYARKTRIWYGFDDWHSNATDLYYMLHVIGNYDDPELELSDTTRKHLAKLPFRDNEMLHILKLMATDNRTADLYFRRMLLHLDADLGIMQSSLRSVRRLAMNWPDIGRRERQLVITRLLLFLRNRCNMSDLTIRIKEYARDHSMVIDDKETTSATLTHLIKLHKLDEDGDAVATTSADIASVVMPLGKVQRRKPDGKD